MSSRPPTPDRGMSGAGAARFDEARFREVMGHFATGVTIVTAMEGRSPSVSPAGLHVVVHRPALGGTGPG